VIYKSESVSCGITFRLRYILYKVETRLQVSFLLAHCTEHCQARALWLITASSHVFQLKWLTTIIYLQLAAHLRDALRIQRPLLVNVFLPHGPPSRQVSTS